MIWNSRQTFCATSTSLAIDGGRVRLTGDARVSPHAFANWAANQTFRGDGLTDAIGAKAISAVTLVVMHNTTLEAASASYSGLYRSNALGGCLGRVNEQELR